jgi:predicted RNase H-like HicB family nuclease
MMEKDLKYYLSLDYPHTVEKVEENGEDYISLEIPDLPGCGASGKTYEEALAGLNEAKELWIEASLERKIPIPEPVSEEDFSGKFLLRIPARLHMDLAKQANLKKLSLNQYVKSILEKANLMEFEKRELQTIIGFLEQTVKLLTMQNERIEELEYKVQSIVETYRPMQPTGAEFQVSDTPGVGANLITAVGTGSDYCYYFPRNLPQG